MLEQNFMEVVADVQQSFILFVLEQMAQSVFMTNIEV